jgi:hypothetical protein
VKTCVITATANNFLVLTAEGELLRSGPQLSFYRYLQTKYVKYASARLYNLEVVP